ncbi:MAG: hypothetical protein FJ303_01305 [Planctomycetes bacterium]|nr:hypothetical protein [Planctomycetota bacterium]
MSRRGSVRHLFALGLAGLLVWLALGASASAGELEGRWRNGYWTDVNTGHKDNLRGRFRQTSDGNYRVVFTGKFAVIIPFRFATTLNVVGRDGDKVLMQGESRLPGFGRFTYNATADSNNFTAQYDSRRWRGEFRLWR